MSRARNFGCGIGFCAAFGLLICTLYGLQTRISVAANQPPPSSVEIASTPTAVPPESEDAIPAVDQTASDVLPLGDDALGRALQAYYADSASDPLWITRNGATPKAVKLLGVLAGAGREGLDPGLYRLEDINRILERKARDSYREADALISRALVLFSMDRLLGQTRRSLGYAKQVALLKSEEGLSVDELLKQAHESDDIEAFLKTLMPQTPQYSQLMAGLGDLEAQRQTARSYAPVPSGKTLRSGDRDPRVAVIRLRLADEPDATDETAKAVTDGATETPTKTEKVVDGADVVGPTAGVADESTGEITAGSDEEAVRSAEITAPTEDRASELVGAVDGASDSADPPRVVSKSPFFDQALVDQVKAFQKRHGLHPDGIVGPQTLAQMNRGVEAQIDLVYLALERWRRMPRDLGETYVLVNIPQFELYLYEGQSTVLHMKVAVGSPGNATPVFSDTIKYMEFNPYWNVPVSIARSETVPNQIRNPDYLSRRNFSVTDSSGQAVDPSQIDWSDPAYVSRNYRFRQRPGRGNALGTVKFMFPNRHAVYLHDTNAPGVFSRANRAVSHGCVRVENPEGLADYILKNFTRRTDRTYGSFLGPNPRTVTLDKPLELHLVYMTAWADADGKLTFSNDLYQLDPPLLKQLAAFRPGSIQQCDAATAHQEAKNAR